MNLNIPKERIKPSQCYMNSFEIILANMDAFKNNLYRVCIGYVAYNSNLNLLFRHAYIVNNKGEVVYDSTKEYMDRVPCEYNNIYIFENLDYFNHICNLCTNSKDCHISFNSLQEITHDNDLEFVRKNNIYEFMSGHDLLIRNNKAKE